MSNYVIFVIIVVIIAHGNRDPSAFQLQYTIEDNFIIKNGFNNIKTSNDFWDWAHSTIVDELRASFWYNGKPPYGLRGFIGDMQNRILGYGWMRQIRVKPNTCKVHKMVYNITQNCAQGSIFIDEDDTDYCNQWEEQNELTKSLPSCEMPQFKYTTADKLEALNYNARVDYYSGGGYVHEIKGTFDKSKKELKRLQSERWINNHTRAVFLEFSIYNANVNLFGIVTIIAEFIPGGGILPFWRIEPVRLLHHHEPSGKFIMYCEIFFVLYIFYFTIKEIIEMKRRKMAYWHDYWSWGEWSIIIAAFVALGLYIHRYFLTKAILKTFSTTKGNGYINLQYVGIIDEYYGYLLGYILFICNIKFVKLLRFNNMFAMLILTLKTAWEDLSGFFGVFFLVFFAFVQLFYMILFTDLEDFKTIIAALETCFTMLLNKFKFGKMKDVSITAAVMFFVFAISCTWILINVLLTIIIEAFEIVKSELFVQGNKYEIIQFIKSRARMASGLEVAPKPQSIVRKHDEIVEDHGEKLEQDLDSESEHEEDEQDPEPDIPTDDLTKKMDMFLNYVNNTYFDGEIDLKSKDAFKRDLKLQKKLDMRQEPKPTVRKRVIFRTE